MLNTLFSKPGQVLYIKRIPTVSLNTRPSEMTQLVLYEYNSNAEHTVFRTGTSNMKRIPTVAVWYDSAIVLYEYNSNAEHTVFRTGTSIMKRIPTVAVWYLPWARRDQQSTERAKPWSHSRKP